MLIVFSVWTLQRVVGQPQQIFSKNSLHISKFESGFVQNAFYGGYFLMALPAGMIGRRFGYKGGIIVGLSIAVAECVLVCACDGRPHLRRVLARITRLGIGPGVFGNNSQSLYDRAWAARKWSNSHQFGAKAALAWEQFSECSSGAHTILSTNKEFNTSNPHLYIPYLGIGIAAAILLSLFIPAKVPDLLAVEEFKAEAARQKRSNRCTNSHISRWVWSISISL